MARFRFFKVIEKALKLLVVGTFRVPFVLFDAQPFVAFKLLKKGSFFFSKIHYFVLLSIFGHIYCVTLLSIYTKKLASRKRNYGTFRVFRKSPDFVTICNNFTIDKRLFLEYYPLGFCNYTQLLMHLFVQNGDRFMKRFIRSNRWEIVSAAVISGVFTASVVIAMAVSAF